MLDNDIESKNEFGKYEEATIVGLAFENSEFFSTIMPYLDESYFEQAHCKFVFAIIKHYYTKHSVIISRKMCLDVAKQAMNTDSQFDDVLELIEKTIDPREIPIIMERLVEWARKRAYGKLYTESAIDAHASGDYSYVDKVIEEARKITEFNSNFFFFFKDYDRLFIKENEEKLTTGFSRLDDVLNNGGPTRGEAVCFLAPTGVGKSIALVNCGVASIINNKNVLHVTCEMSKDKTGCRYVGCFTNEWIESRFHPDVQVKMKQSLIQKRDNYQSQLIIVEYPPNEITVDTIRMNCDVLRRMYGIKIDVIIIDYLELLMPRNTIGLDKDYNIQKRVSTEVCGLAKKENALVFTATQTNRDGNENLNNTKQDQVIELNKIAESYGKSMPLDYMISINQNKQEYEEGKIEDAITNARCRFYVAKNRNGPKFITISARINYETMRMTEHNE